MQRILKIKIFYNNIIKIDNSSHQFLYSRFLDGLKKNIKSNPTLSIVIEKYTFYRIYTVIDCTQHSTSSQHCSVKK